MADRPILFSAPMVRAILAGRKTQTRRVIKLPTKGEYVRPDMGGWAPTTSGGPGTFTIGRGGERIPVPEEPAIWNQTTGTCLGMFCRVGDRLWVREACAILHDTAVYREGHEEAQSRGPRVNVRWRPSIHMPRWASRLTLAVTEVRVERLHDISEEDAVAEGASLGMIYERETPTHRAGFHDIWVAINGPNAWDANPWVAAISFEVESRNIEATPTHPEPRP